jgi:hypothetical protein
MPNYGWVQNTSNLSTVRDTIDIVPNHGVGHNDLMAIIKQFRISHGGLPNRWNWDARCRIKAIQALGLVKIDRHIQGYDLTELGRKLKACTKSTNIRRRLRLLTDDEKEIFKRGLLTNPPVIRVLSLLDEDRRNSNEGLSKYDIGKNLGFVGDVGFTHIDPYWVVSQGLSFNNKEGDADKWARTILSWLTQVGWVNQDGYKEINGKKLAIYKSIPEVERILRYDAKRIKRNVPIEMLCSQHHSFPKLIQKRRSIILRNLQNAKTSTQIINDLRRQGLEANEEVFKFEILNLKNAGFSIVESGGYYKLAEKINLDIIPIPSVSNALNAIEALIQQSVVKYEATIPAKFVDHLIRFGCVGDMNREFESIVAEYFRFLGYDTDYLGQGRGRAPDSIVKYKHPSHYARSYGLIVDSKSTSGKYNFPVGDKRKMKEYIMRYGPKLLAEHIQNHAFLFVSSDFIDDITRHIEEIRSETDIAGSAIKVIVLLELGNKIKLRQLLIENIYNKFTCNNLITI